MALTPQDGVEDIQIIDGDIWTAQSSGAYRLKATELANYSWETPLNPVVDIRSWTIAKVRGEPWIGTMLGAYRINSLGQPEPVLRDTPFDELPVNVILESPVDNQVWLGGVWGLLKLEQDGTPALVLSEDVNTVVALQDARGEPELWIGTQRNAYRVSSTGELTPIWDVGHNVVDIQKVGDTVWLLTAVGGGLPGPAFRMTDPEPKEVDLRISAVLERGHDVLLGANDGVYKYIAASNTPSLLVATDAVNSMVTLGERLWFGTVNGLFELGETDQLDLVGKQEVFGLHEIGGKIWLETPKGAFRLDEDVEIVADLKDQFVFGGEVGLGTVRYERDGKKAYNGLVDGKFKAILRFSKSELEEAIKGDFYEPVSIASSSPKIHSLGYKKIYIEVRDSFGNTNAPTEKPPWALMIAPLGGGVVIWMMSFVFVVLAPYWKFAMRVVNAPPAVVGYLAGIRVFLLSKGVGYYLLKPYRENLSKSAKSTDELDWVVDELINSKKLLIWEGKKSLINEPLGRQIAAGRFQELKDYIPVFVRLPLVQAKDVDILAAEVLKQGDITDLDLGKYLLNHQQVVYLFDDLEELADHKEGAKLPNLEAFITSNSARNLFVICSQKHDKARHLADQMGFKILNSPAVTVEEALPDSALENGRETSV